MTLSLPDPITTYIAATNSGDAAAIATAFSPEGRVHDEGHVHSGRPEITQWAKDTVGRYQMQMAPLSYDVEGAHHRLKAQVSGTFPGSPINLTFHYTLSDAGILTLEIGA